MNFAEAVILAYTIADGSSGINDDFYPSVCISSLISLSEPLITAVKFTYFLLTDYL